MHSRGDLSHVENVFVAQIRFPRLFLHKTMLGKPIRRALLKGGDTAVEQAEGGPRFGGCWPLDPEGHHPGFFLSSSNVWVSFCVIWRWGPPPWTGTEIPWGVQGVGHGVYGDEQGGC